MSDSIPAERTNELETVTICGSEFRLEPFNEGQADAWAEISDKYGLDKLQERQIIISQQMQQLQGARVKDQQTVIETLEKRLAEHRAGDPDKWDDAAIAKLVDRLDLETGKLIQLQQGEANVVAERGLEIANELDELAAVQHEAGLELAHRLAGSAEPMEAWSRRATQEDYTAVERFVKAGVTPFINRALRRARTRGRGTSGVSKQ